MTSFQSVECSGASTGDNRLQLKLKQGAQITTRSVARDHRTFWLPEVIFTARDGKNGLYGRASPSSGESNQSTLDCNDSLSFLPSGVSVDFKLKVQVELKITIAQFPTDGSCDMWTVNRWKKNHEHTTTLKGNLISGRAITFTTILYIVAVEGPDVSKVLNVIVSHRTHVACPVFALISPEENNLPFSEFLTLNFTTQSIMGPNCKTEYESSEKHVYWWTSEKY